MMVSCTLCIQAHTIMVKQVLNFKNNFDDKKVNKKMAEFKSIILDLDSDLGPIISGTNRLTLLLLEYI